LSSITKATFLPQFATLVHTPATIRQPVSRKKLALKPPVTAVALCFGAQKIMRTALYRHPCPIALCQCYFPRALRMRAGAIRLLATGAGHGPDASPSLLGGLMGTAILIRFNGFMAESFTE
jgi:hypothetical protein